MSVAELSDLRKQRAAEQAGDYDFHLTSVAGAAVVYVISRHADRDGNQPIYTVHSDGRCNCPDFIHRCSQVEGLKCKHGRMVEAWLADCGAPQGNPVETLAAESCHGCGFPRHGEECGLCGSVLVQVGLPMRSPAQAARRARYEAEVTAGLWG